MDKGEFLLIDNSNSFTKAALSERDALSSPSLRIATPELSPEVFREMLKDWRFDRVILSSVVPEKAAVLREALAGWPVLEVNATVNLGVEIDYPEPATIGADRLANAASAAALYGAPVVVVDFGTAVSFDIIASNRAYVGGVIAPGLEAMTDYLYQRTALLPKIALLEPPRAIGKSTKEAMLSGAVYGYRGLIRQILEEIKKELSVQTLPVVATGGYAELIAAGLPEIGKIAQNLTLEGLRIIGVLNPLESGRETGES